MKINNLAPHSRVWIYQSDRELTDAESARIKLMADAFVEQWTAHGKEVHGSADVKYNRFLVLFADEEATSVSGCSIDSSVAFVKKLGAEFGLDFFDRKQMAWLENAEVKTAAMHDFWALRKAGVINANTSVFNNLVKNKAEFDTSWICPFEQSWHAEMFR